MDELPLMFYLPLYLITHTSWVALQQLLSLGLGESSALHILMFPSFQYNKFNFNS